MRNQEKHPVDELFAKRLQGLEQTPSPRAWEELQGRLTKKKDTRKGVYWAIAASVALLIGCLGTFFYRGAEEHLATTRPQKQLPVSEKPSQLPATTPEPPPLTQRTEPDFAPEGREPTPDKRMQRTHAAKPVPARTATQIAQQKKQTIVEEKLVTEAKLPAEDTQEMGTIATRPTDVIEHNPATSEVTVVVVELTDPVADTSDAAEPTANRPAARKAEKLWQAIKKAKKSEINLDKDAIVAWVKERNTKN